MFNNKSDTKIYIYVYRHIISKRLFLKKIFCLENFRQKKFFIPLFEFVMGNKLVYLFYKSLFLQNTEGAILHFHEYSISIKHINNEPTCTNIE